MIQMSIDYISIFSIFHFIIQLLLYGIGVFIQAKTIIVCFEEKSKTWQILIVHAVVLVIIFGNDIVFLNVLNWYPNVFIFTGNWPCYIFAFVDMYGAVSIGLNTLIVAIMKYIFIVYALKAMLFESRIQNSFVAFHIVFPLVFAILLMLSYELTDLDENITKCLNPSNEIQVIKPAATHSTILIIFQIIFSIACGANVLEGFFYYQTFKTMKR